MIDDNINVFAVICAITIISLTALTLTFNGEINSTWEQNSGSLTIKKVETKQLK